MGQGAWRDVVAKGEAMVAIAHVVLFVGPHGMSVFHAWHKTPTPMEKELVVVRTYWSHLAQAVGGHGVGLT